MPGTRKLGRPTAHRKAMMRGMVTLLLENGQVETTLARAKEVRSIAEKMITLGKKNTLASRRAALAYITKEEVVTLFMAVLEMLKLGKVHVRQKDMFQRITLVPGRREADGEA